MDLTPFLANAANGTPEEGLESMEIPGRVAVAAKGRFLLRALCRSFGGYSRITCAVTDQEACLGYLAAAADEPYQLLVCTDFLESGNGFDLVREARQLHPKLHCVILALGDAIPAECSEAPWLEAVVAEADFVDDQQPLRAAVMAVLGGHYYRSPSLRSGILPYLSCPRLTPREYEVLDLLASGLSDREIATRLVVSNETAHTYTKRLLQTLNVHNRLQAVLNGMRCGMVQILAERLQASPQEPASLPATAVQRSNPPLLPPQARDQRVKHVLAIILGGGAGTRLQPLTLTRAKPAVPLGGIYRLIDIPISNCINSGINKIYALTQFNSQSLNRHISLTYNLSSDFSDGFVEVLAAQQTPDSPSWFQGTADAVRQYRELIEAWNVDQLLILSGDQLYRMDYQAFIEAHRASGAALTVAALPVDAATAAGFGLMRTDNNGQIREFREKPSGEALAAMRVDTGALGLSQEEALRRPFLASMGIYVFQRETLFQLLNSHPEATDFGKDIIPAALSAGHHLQSHLFDGYWEDIGTIKAFYDANLALADEQPAFSFDDEQAPIYTRARYLPPSQIHDAQVQRSILSEGCRLDRCVVDHCVLGLRLRVEEGVVLKDTLVMGADSFESERERAVVRAHGGVPLGIGKGSKISNAILDKNVRIGCNVQVINKDRVQEADRTALGFTIRSGIVVIEKNTTIDDGTII